MQILISLMLKLELLNLCFFFLEKVWVLFKYEVIDQMFSTLIQYANQSFNQIIIG